MSFIKSRWIASLLAILMGIATTVPVLYLQIPAILKNLPQVHIETPPLLWSFKDAEVEKLIGELGSERKRLEEREADLDKMSAQLSAEREELNKVRADIQIMRDQMSSSILEMDEAEAKNLKSLAGTYSALSAAAAVNILMEMDETMVVKILSLMKADKVGAIFQEMARPRSPDTGLAKRAALISDKLRLLKAKKEAPKP